MPLNYPTVRGRYVGAHICGNDLAPKRLARESQLSKKRLSNLAVRTVCADHVIRREGLLSFWCLDLDPRFLLFLLNPNNLVRPLHIRVRQRGQMLMQQHHQPIQGQDLHRIWILHIGLQAGDVCAVGFPPADRVWNKPLLLDVG